MPGPVLQQRTRVRQTDETHPLELALRWRQGGQDTKAKPDQRVVTELWRIRTGSCESESLCGQGGAFWAES